MDTIAHFDWRSVIDATAGTSEQTIKALDSYFAPFACRPAEEGHPCLRCGKPLTGLTAVFLGGGFEWGLAHGEGRCANCGWPARAMHYIKDEEGEFLTLRHFVLQYHPDVVVGTREPVSPTKSEGET